MSKISFRIKQNDDYSNLKEFKAGVSGLGTVRTRTIFSLYLWYTAQTYNVTMSTFAGYTVCLAIGHTVEEASIQILYIFNKIDNWVQKWLIKLHKN